MLTYHARLALEFLQARSPAERDTVTLASIVRHVALSYALSPATTTSLLAETTQEAQRRGLVPQEGD